MIQLPPIVAKGSGVVKNPEPKSDLPSQPTASDQKAEDRSEKDVEGKVER